MSTLIYCGKTYDLTAELGPAPTQAAADAFMARVEAERLARSQPRFRLAADTAKRRWRRWAFERKARPLITLGADGSKSVMTRRGRVLWPVLR